MNITVNEKSLSLLINDMKSNDDIIAFLNAVIDEELKKENPDCDLIDECINAIADIEDNDTALPMLKIALTPDSIRKIVNKNRTSWKSLNRALRIAIVAAVIATGTFTVNAAVKSATGVDVIKEVASAVAQVFTKSDDDDNLSEYVNQNNNSNDNADGNSTAQSNPDVESQSTDDKTNSDVKSGTQNKNTDNKNNSTKIDDKPLITQPSVSYAPAPDNGKAPNKNNNSSDSDKEQNPEFTGVEAQYAEMKRNLLIGETLSYDGMKIYALYSDGSRQQVSIDDCTHPTAFDTSKVGDYTLNVQYKSAVFSFGVTVRPNEDTRYSTICSDDEYDYLLCDKGAYIVKYKENDRVINLDAVDGNTVYALGPYLFEDSNIKEFTSSTVKRVYDGAFKNCSSLSKCDMKACTEVGAYAFGGCENLRDFTLAPVLDSIGTASFEKSGINEVTLSNSIRKIPDFAFSECKNLTEVNFLGKVTDIGKNAFNECESLINVNGSGYIVKADEFAFYSCELMEFDTELTRLHSAGHCAFAMCKSANFGDLYGLTYIGVQAFQYCSNIDSVYITGDVKTVPNAAFQGAHIKNLILDDGIEVIEPYAFMSTLIGEINLPESLKEIGTYAFYTTALKTVRGGNNVNEIGTRAFYPSKRLTIYADENNALVQYAKDNNIKCVLSSNEEQRPEKEREKQ